MINITIDSTGKAKAGLVIGLIFAGFCAVGAVGNVKSALTCVDYLKAVKDVQK